jgi:hypothetical protein
VITVTFGTVASAKAKRSFGAVLYQPTIFLRGDGQEAGHIDEGHRLHLACVRA